MHRLAVWWRQLTSGPPRNEQAAAPPRERPRTAPPQRKRSLNEGAHKRGR